MRLILLALAASCSLMLQGCDQPAEGSPFKVWPVGCNKNRPCPKPQPQPLPPPTLSVADASVNENAQSVTIHVTRAGDLTSPTAFTWRTQAGSAAAGTNFTTSSGSLSFGVAQSEATFTVPILDDGVVAGDLTLSITITAQSNGTVIRNGVVTIHNTDVAPAPPPPPPPPATQTCWDGSVILATATCPAVPTPGWVDSPSIAGLSPIASEFDPQSTIFTSYQPGPSRDAGVGAFRFICGATAWLRYDDPLVYPGQLGKSHLHQGYGNIDVTANSTFSSLRTGGYSTCSSPNSNPANRSAYWVPAMLDGKGNVVQPDYEQLYYKRTPKTNPACISDRTGSFSCATIPNGMRYIFGYNMGSGANPAPFTWHCDNTGVGGAVGPGGPTIADALPCPVGARLYNVGGAYPCWDGAHLDSPDHRSHVAYQADLHDGLPFVCPQGFRVGIPVLSLFVFYRIAPGDDPSLWSLSSDAMHPELPKGSTMHADYWEAWDPVIKQMWTDNCIDRELDCVGGALGNGYSIIGADQPRYLINGVWTGTWTNPNHLVPVPPMPGM